MNFRMSLERWVNDELHNILGLSDQTIAQFVISLARMSTTTDDFIGELLTLMEIDL